ncbi:hypothetical protein M2251_002825 [Rhodococcus erythropolis]|nr:hypothetical protein [Rhodococcus erythropolis]
MPSRVRLAIVAGCVAAPLVAVGIVALSERSSEQSPSPGEIVVIGSEGPAAQDVPNEPPPTPNPYAIDYPLPTATLELDFTRSREVGVCTSGRRLSASSRRQGTVSSIARSGETWDQVLLRHLHDQ